MGGVIKVLRLVDWRRHAMALSQWHWVGKYSTWVYGEIGAVREYVHRLSRWVWRGQWLKDKVITAGRVMRCLRPNQSVARVCDTEHSRWIYTPSNVYQKKFFCLTQEYWGCFPCEGWSDGHAIMCAINDIACSLFGPCCQYFMSDVCFWALLAKTIWLSFTRISFI